VIPPRGRSYPAPPRRGAGGNAAAPSPADNPNYVGKIVVDSSPRQEMLNALRVSDWPTWGCEESEFPWHYDRTESCYVLQGSAVVTPDVVHGADEVVICAGDFCIFPRGMSCTWRVTAPIQKHYSFE